MNPNTGLTTCKKVSSNEFYAYRIMHRPCDFNHILRCKRLTQQYIVDMFAKVENERLRYIRLNQTKIRAEEYGCLRDAVANDGTLTAAEVGRLVVLPASFTGGPRYMHECSQDALTYVRKHGTADLFITFTCNPSWSEITIELFTGQTSSDRVDIVSRVFRQKAIKLINLLTKVRILIKL